MECSVANSAVTPSSAVVASSAGESVEEMAGSASGLSLIGLDIGLLVGGETEVV